VEGSTEVTEEVGSPMPSRGVCNSRSHSFCSSVCLSVSPAPLDEVATSDTDYCVCVAEEEDKCPEWWRDERISFPILSAVALGIHLLWSRPQQPWKGHLKTRNINSVVRVNFTLSDPTEAIERFQDDLLEELAHHSQLNHPQSINLDPNQTHRVVLMWGSPQ
jgi:hypothetical protein